ncbi:MAG TPA: malto-oligosyltrehalose trehalohydrolase [Opitutaceae bacterium]|nr:malto-oligosyltrehalose trehalohydrolase [Opitutaceae bacterium]
MTKVSFSTPVGAELAATGVRYRVWAPDNRKVEVCVENGGGTRHLTLVPLEGGFHEAHDLYGRAGERYRFRLDDGPLTPDPASRSQPEGVFGPSEVVNPDAYTWRVPHWKRPAWRGRVIYELHVGTFTPEGTFAAAKARLRELVDLGVNTIELMPVAAFPGTRNWGYDGVFPFAPAACYGPPDALRDLVDAAHEHGLSVMLDVVYNHLGPVGNPLPAFGGCYFHPARQNPWGAALNFDGPQSGPVRAFFLQNACMWIDEYRFDGLRLDSIHSITDESPVPLVAAIATEVHRRGAWVVGEDERNLASVLAPREHGGFGLDGVWADDFHHSVRVALTEQRESHFASFSGDAAEIAATLLRGWYYSGQYYPHWQRARGTPTPQCAPESFVLCISNHDQVGNRPLGDRPHHGRAHAAYRAASLLLCLAPGTPMLFMGQEWAASTPFQFFCEHPGEAGRKVAGGRLAELQRFGLEIDDRTKSAMRDPQDEAAFAASKLRWDERANPPHAGMLALYRDALRLRIEHPVFQSAPRDRWTAWPVRDTAVAVRWRQPEGDWLLLVALRAVGELAFLPEGELRAPVDRRWELQLGTNAAVYGGGADAVAESDERGFRLATPGAALFRAPVARAS